MGKSLLIVEDDPKSLYALQAVLQDHGFHVSACSTAKEAETFLRVSFDAAIIDVRLPDKPGTVVAEQLRRANARTLIIFMTAYNGVNALQQAFPTAIVLLKPLDISNLTRLLNGPSPD
jgi:two-component system NtrC family response regulator